MSESGFLLLKSADGLNRRYFIKNTNINRLPWKGDDGGVFTRKSEAMFYRVKKGKKSEIPKLNSIITFLDIQNSELYSGKVIRRMGPMYGRGNTGVIILRNIKNISSLEY